ncbi:MAG: LapA family protein [Pseudomonadota bacterium]
MLRRTLTVLVVIVVGLAMLTFTAENTGSIEVNLLFFSVTAPVALAFTVAFAVGWLFGLACMGLWALRMLRDRHSLKRSLKVSESEVSSLRNLPLNDAD